MDFPILVFAHDHKLVYYIKTECKKKTKNDKQVDYFQLKLFKLNLSTFIVSYTVCNGKRYSGC